MVLFATPEKFQMEMVHLTALGSKLNSVETIYFIDAIMYLPAGALEHIKSIE